MDTSCVHKCTHTRIIPLFSGSSIDDYFFVNLTSPPAKRIHSVLLFDMLNNNSSYNTCDGLCG